MVEPAFSFSSPYHAFSNSLATGVLKLTALATEPLPPRSVMTPLSSPGVSVQRNRRLRTLPSPLAAKAVELPPDQMRPAT